MPKGIKTCEMVRWNTDGLEALPALDTFHPSHFVSGSVLAASLFCTHVSSFLPVQNRVDIRRYFKRLLQLLEIIDELLLSGLKPWAKLLPLRGAGLVPFP